LKPLVRALAALALLAVSSGAAAQQRTVLPGDVTPLRYDISVVPDATHLAFSGTAAISIDVKRATSRIELNAANLVFQRVTVSGAPGAPKITYNASEETATLLFASLVTEGGHVLTIDYTGKINNDPAGFFALDYGSSGRRKRALFTQFENSDARRFVPCWDEPARKAVFVLSATVPASEMAVSNMPIAASENLPGGMKRVQFAPSPPMSSYLFFFGLGDFERIARRVNGVDVGVIVKRGDAARGAFALNAALQILPYYEDYFAVKYPLPKLDLIAGPGESLFFGAMENWGAIFCFEYDLLVDAKISTASDRRDVYITIAHEMAHQWFGDLVTMEWWDDLWLNEGFASWMQLKATSHFHPEWDVWRDALAAKEEAMRVDARAGTHPIIQPIRDVLQAGEAFDTITYSKGQAVITMLENYLGPDSFRDGVRRYITAHAYGNTVSDDLWREFDATSAKPVTQVARDFTVQSGVPLIRATESGDTLHLVQDRYAEDDSGKAPTSWRVPVVEGAPGAPSLWRGLVSRTAPAEVALRQQRLAIVNFRQAGYFRTLYEPAMFAALVPAFGKLAPADQVGLLNDADALGMSGYEPLSDYAALVSQTAPGMDANVLDTVATQLEAMDELCAGLPEQPAFRGFALRILDPVFARVGWTAHRNEGSTVPVLREDLLSALGELDDSSVVAQARRRFDEFLKGIRSFSADERGSLLEIVARHADVAIWNELHTRAKAARTSLERRDYYVLLGRARDRLLAARALALALSGEPPVTTRPAILIAVAHYHPQMALTFFAAHAVAFNAFIEPDSRADFAPQLAASSVDPATIETLRAYADAHIPPEARGALNRTEAAIAFKARVRQDRLPELDRWIAAH
jgi:aminopeptidase N